MNFLQKIQSLPEGKRKVILWALMVIVATLLFILYIKIVKQKINDFSGEEFKKNLNLPDIKKELNDNLPPLEVSESELSEIMQEIASSTGSEVATQTESGAATTEQNLFENQ